MANSREIKKKLNETGKNWKKQDNAEFKLDGKQMAIKIKIKKTS